ncbi:MAG TPA: site-specific DNA-methyltransferase [Terriglobia bacterium]|nr:site-specific DNA-methyltransferase [Terriglobia bacterium]
MDQQGLTSQSDSINLHSDMSLRLDQIIFGDCPQALKKCGRESVDLVVTSPPYADRRSKTYGGISADKYVEWFMPIGDELQRVLKPTGSFVLNIKEIVVGGERHTYVIELILEMRKRGWLWTEEYIWHKKNCHPGKWPNRFRDSWERCLHFTKQRKFSMYQDAVMVPMGDWRLARLKNLSETDRTRDNSHVGSGFGKNVSHWVGRDKAYPTNVLHMATECGNTNHSAAFPISLPTWFIKLFTKPGDVVLDPFIGSGTTAVASKQLGRHYIGVDHNPEFCELARKRVDTASSSRERRAKANGSGRVGASNHHTPSLFMRSHVINP